MPIRAVLVLFVFGFLCVACGEDEPAPTDTPSELEADTEELDEAEDLDLEVELDPDLDPDTDQSEEQEQELEVEDVDTFEVYMDPVVFALVQMDTDLREILYLRGGNVIAMPNMRIKAESITRTPIPGQLVAFIYPFPGSHAQPSQSWTGSDGLTDVLEFTLVADTAKDNAAFLLTPYLIGTEPNILAEKKVDGLAVDVELHYPEDQNGEPLPLIGDGQSSYPVRIGVARADGKTLLGEFEVELEMVLSGGSSPLSIDGEIKKRWTLDLATGEILTQFVSTRAGAETAVFFLRFYQKGARRGQKTLTLELLAP